MCVHAVVPQSTRTVRGVMKCVTLCVCVCVSLHSTRRTSRTGTSSLKTCCSPTARAARRTLAQPKRWSTLSYPVLSTYMSSLWLESSPSDRPTALICCALLSRWSDKSNREKESGCQQQHLDSWAATAKARTARSSWSTSGAEHIFGAQALVVPGFF